MPVILPSAAYNPAALGTLDYSQDAISPLDGDALNPVIEFDDEGTIPRYYFTPRFSPTSSYQPSLSTPVSYREFPTPEARVFDIMRQPRQPSPRRGISSIDRNSEYRTSRADSDFDSLYDVSDDEAEVLIHNSNSVKQAEKTGRNRYPSLIIPSPSAWPTIEKLQSALSALPPTPSRLLEPPRQVMSMIASHNLQVPGYFAAPPSLDGSLSSEEIDQLSCPSTPETGSRQSPVPRNDWGPVQLDWQALETLQHLRAPSPASSDTGSEREMPHAVESQDEVGGGGEMQEVSRTSFLGLTIPPFVIYNGSTANSPLSELSIPSPGGFFSSLHSTARHTWSIPKRDESAPNTSTAEQFYELPWDVRRNTIAEQIVTIPENQRQSTLGGSTLNGLDDGLPTSRPVLLGDIDEAMEVAEIRPAKSIFQYNEGYHAELKKLSTANLERTDLWLAEQDELQSALREMNDMSSLVPSRTSHSRGNSLDKVKKSVKFAEEPQKSPTTVKESKHNMTYIQGFEFLRDRSRKHDSFIHRQTRAEALHVQRRCMPQFHRDALLGKFVLTNPVRPSPPRPVSEFYTDDPTVLKERIARAQMERQALDQMLPAMWVLQALKQMNGGRLLSAPAARRVLRTGAPRVLDVGGIPTSDWAWELAYDYPYASVITVYTAGNNLSPDVKGPDNHKHQVVPNLWTLPFPSGHFDVISARSLFELLKTDKPLGRSLDEYDLCLKECFRCLKPGGIFEFSLIDSDIIHAGRQAQAMGVEFGFNLKTRGYDPSPTKTFIPRLRKAGFQGAQRMWMILPMGKTAAHWKDVVSVGAEEKLEEKTISPDGQVKVCDAPVYGSTVDVAMMTGIVGSWMWERWMLKLQLEMGKDEQKLLEGVVQVLEEGAKEGSGWRYMMGHARKREVPKR